MTTDRWEDITEILPGVFLGDAKDGYSFHETHKGVAICVHENPDNHNGRGPFIPIMVGVKSDFFMASRLMLEAATSAIRHYQKTGIPVLVHCHAGVERSPLTMAWFLKRYQYCKTLPEAYEFIMQKRPIVQDRTHWLQPRDQK